MRQQTFSGDEDGAYIDAVQTGGTRIDSDVYLEIFLFGDQVFEVDYTNPVTEMVGRRACRGDYMKADIERRYPKARDADDAAILVTQEAVGIE